MRFRDGNFRHPPDTAACYFCGGAACVILDNRYYGPGNWPEVCKDCCGTGVTPIPFEDVGAESCPDVRPAKGRKK